ncbi:Protein MRG1 [Bienertia sinuspersici]
MSNSIKVESEIKEEDNSDSITGDTTCPYLEGENVIANFHGHFYHAKVVKVEFYEGWKFFIHYWHWKKSWDEWVRADRLMKLTEENSQLVMHDKKKVTNVKVGHLSRTKSGKYSDSHGTKHKIDSTLICLKRKREHDMVKGEDSGPVEKLINISVPPTLKKQLLDDFELIKQMGMLVKLPRTPNVDEIIKKYQEYRRRKDDVTSASLGEVLSGLCAYFNKALPIILLYNEERQQYEEAITENMFPSTVYGAEHLLRLFVKLPALIYDLEIENETLQNLQQNLHDFLKFLQKNQSVFFLSAYHGRERSSRSTDKEFN